MKETDQMRRRYGGYHTGSSGRRSQFELSDRRASHYSNDQFGSGNPRRSWEKNNDRRRNLYHFGKGPKGYQRSSERIYEDVCEALMRNPEIDASEVEVDVNDGIVTLTGTVDSRRTKRRVEAEVDAILGVEDIVNMLSLTGEIGQDVRSQGSSLESRIKDKSDLKVTKFIPELREKVFLYWIRPEYLENWAYPQGMGLKVPQFEAKVGGKYRFEHSGSEGTYICNGYLKELIPNEKLVQIESVRDPKGYLVFENLESTILFRDASGGTEISVLQSGFKDEETLKVCEESWNQCLENLSGLISGGFHTKPDQGLDEGRILLHR